MYYLTKFDDAVLRYYNIKMMTGENILVDYFFLNKSLIFGNVIGPLNADERD